ncbi:MAG: hypothetical protein NTX82_05505 [Candidatus Parcubacteria bacterium]|nr:hypothetical protein [Candidatus Parcubacteria bacterium]
MKKSTVYLVIFCLTLAIFCSCSKGASNGAKDYTVRIVVSGDSGGYGLGSYGNHQVDKTLLDTTLKASDKITLFTADGKSQQLKWDQKLKAFTHIFKIQTTKFDSGDTTFAVYRPSQDPVCLGANPPCKDEPVYGIYAETLNDDGSVKCNVELRHYVNVQFGGKPQMYTGTGIYGFYGNGCTINWKDNHLFTE